MQLPRQFEYPNALMKLDYPLQNQLSFMPTTVEQSPIALTIKIIEEQNI